MTKRTYRLLYTEDTEGYGEDNTSDAKVIEFPAKNDIDARKLAASKATKLLKNKKVWDIFDLEECPRPARTVRWSPPTRKAR